VNQFLEIESEITSQYLNDENLFLPWVIDFNGEKNSTLLPQLVWNAGIALCSNLHRSFDRGLISNNPDYIVYATESIFEVGLYSVLQFEGQKIDPSVNSGYWPRRESLAWGWRNIFRSK